MLNVRAIWLVLVVFSFSAGAAPIDDADAALMRGEYESAVATLTALAKGGDAVAMVRLASLYHRGEGVTRNVEKAVDLYLSSAELGNADAQFNLGNMYLLGEGVDEDESWALTFYRLAAKQGHQLATANLNEMIRAGVATDAAELTGLPQSQLVDSDLNVVESDVVPSELGSSVAVAKTDQIVLSEEPPLQATIIPSPSQEAELQPDETIDRRSGGIASHEVIEPMTMSNITTDVEFQAEKQLEKSVDDSEQSDDGQKIINEETPAVVSNAALTSVDRDAEPIESVATTPLELAELPSSDAPVSADESLVNLEPLEPSEEVPAYSSDEAQAIRIAEQHGITVNIDGEPIKAKAPTSEPGVAPLEQYAEQAARFDHAERLLAQDETEQGIKLLKELAAGGYADAASELSARAERGEGLTQSRSESLKWRQVAADLGDPKAQFQLAEQYMRGDGVDPDDAMAITYYRDAARGGHTLAKEKLQLIYADAGLPLPDFSRPRAPIAIYPSSAEEIVDLPANSVDVEPETIASSRSKVEAESVELSATDEEDLTSDTDQPPLPPSTGVVPEQRERATLEELVANDKLDHLEATQPESPIEAVPDLEMNGDTVTPSIDPVSSSEALHTGISVTTAPPEDATEERDLAITSDPIPQRIVTPTIVVIHPPAHERIVSSESTMELEASRPANHQVIAGSVLATEPKELPIVYGGPELTPQPGQTKGPVGVGITQSDADLVVERLVPEIVESEPLVDLEPPAREVIEPHEVAEPVRTVREENQVPSTSPPQSVQGSNVVAIEKSQPPSTGILGRMKNLFSRDSDQSLIKSTGFRTATAATTINQMRGAGPATAAIVAKSVSSIERTTEENSEETTSSNEVEQLIVMRMDDTAPGAEETMVEVQEKVEVPSDGTIHDAKVALAERRFTQAAALFEKLALGGDAEAQAHLGYMFYQGEGVEKNLEQAVEWYRRAAVQGNRDAQYNLAVAYAFGEGIEQNDVEAVNWYRRAAEQGSAIAQYSLGVSYAIGEGVQRDDVEAMKWYRAAAEQGYAAAQYNLGYGYRSGQGTDVDNAQALEWFLAAATNGHASAQYSLGYMYRSGRGVERNVEEAVKWYQLAAAQGHLDARADLASLNPDTL